MNFRKSQVHDSITAGNGRQRPPSYAFSRSLCSARVFAMEKQTHVRPTGCVSHAPRRTPGPGWISRPPRRRPGQFRARTHRTLAMKSNSYHFVEVLRTARKGRGERSVQCSMWSDRHIMRMILQVPSSKHIASHPPTHSQTTLKPPTKICSPQSPKNVAPPPNRFTARAPPLTSPCF